MTGMDEPVTLTTRLSRQGNSTGLTLSREVLDAAGLARGATVRVEAAPGRVVITPAEGTDAEAMALFEASLGRYGRAYAILAK